MLETITSKKLVVSAIIFLFSNYSEPVIAASLNDIPAPQVTQDSVLTSTAPQVSVSAPRIVPFDFSQALFQAGDKVSIQSVNFSNDLINSLNNILFTFSEKKFPFVKGGYTNDQAGFVCLSGCNLQTGKLSIQRAQNALEQRMGTLLENPIKYKLRSDVLNVGLSPKIFSDSHTHSKLIAMDAWDFRLENEPFYSQLALDQMFMTAFASFKAYCQLCQKEHHSKVMHSGFWGKDYKNNPQVAAALQMLAGEAAGLDQLYFHGLSDEVLSETFAFLKAESGKPIYLILQDLLQNTTEFNWHPVI